MTRPTNTDLADALREIANTMPLGSALVLRLAADRLGQPVADTDGWTAWGGGDDCPVTAGTTTEVKFRNGDVHTDNLPEMWSWGDCQESTIVAYRVVR